MVSRAKQATVALNLLAIAVVGLLYRMDSADDQIMDQKAYSEATTNELISPKEETTLSLLDTGIKMVGVDLPAPPPVLVAPMISAAVMPATSNVPVAQQNLTMQPELKSKRVLIPMKVSIASPKPNPVLKNSLAKPEKVVPSPKALLKKEKLALTLPNVTSKPPNLTPLSPKKGPPKASKSSNPKAGEVASLSARIKASAEHQKLPSSLSAKESSMTPMTPIPDVGAPRLEMHIKQANLLRGQKTLNAVIGEGGLDMEMFWPPTAQQSEHLYKVMTQCFGMQSAVIDSEVSCFSQMGKMDKAPLDCLLCYEKLCSLLVVMRSK